MNSLLTRLRLRSTFSLKDEGEHTVPLLHDVVSCGFDRRDGMEANVLAVQREDAACSGGSGE